MKNRLSEETFGGKEPRTRPPAGGGPMGAASRYFDTLEETIAGHPGTSLVTAFLAGILLAWWIKRR